MKKSAGRSFSFVMLLLLLVNCIESRTFRAQALEDEQIVLRGHRGGVSDVRFSPDGLLLASSGIDGTVRLWDANLGKELRIIQGHEKEVFAIAFSADGTRLASSSFDCTVQVWNVKSGSRIRSLAFDSYATAIDISSRGMLAVGLQNTAVEIFDVATGQPVNELHVQWPVYSLAFSHDGTILATGGPIQIWDTETWKQVARPSAPGGVFDLEFAPNRAILASAHLRGVACIWSESTYEQVQACESPVSFRGMGPKGSTPMQAPMPLAAVAFSPDGETFASAGADGIVRLWSVESGSMIKEFRGHTMSVVGLCFRPDGQVLASASLDGTIRMWKLH